MGRCYRAYRMPIAQIQTKIGICLKAKKISYGNLPLVKRIKSTATRKVHTQNKYFKLHLQFILNVKWYKQMRQKCHVAFKNKVNNNTCDLLFYNPRLKQYEFHYERSAKNGASSLWFSGKNRSMSGPTRHDTIRPRDAFDELISLQPRGRMTNGLPW